jgi:hypothetical protein
MVTRENCLEDIVQLGLFVWDTKKSCLCLQTLFKCGNWLGDTAAIILLNLVERLQEKTDLPPLSPISIASSQSSSRVAIVLADGGVNSFGTQPLRLRPQCPPSRASHPLATFLPPFPSILYGLPLLPGQRRCEALPNRSGVVDCPSAVAAGSTSPISGGARSVRPHRPTQWPTSLARGGARGTSRPPRPEAAAVEPSSCSSSSAVVPSCAAGVLAPRARETEDALPRLQISTCPCAVPQPRGAHASLRLQHGPPSAFHTDHRARSSVVGPAGASCHPRRPQGGVDGCGVTVPDAPGQRRGVPAAATRHGEEEMSPTAATAAVPSQEAAEARWFLEIRRG